MVKQFLALKANYGITDWLKQRITALIMLASLLFLFAFILILNQTISNTISSWHKLFSYSFIKIFVQLTIVALLLHGWIGMRDIWMDYVKLPSLRIVLYTLTILWLSGSFVYSVIVLWR